MSIAIGKSQGYTVINKQMFEVNNCQNGNFMRNFGIPYDSSEKVTNITHAKDTK